MTASASKPSSTPDDIRCALFQDLTSEECLHVLELFEEERFLQGETILCEGLSIQMLWIIVQGRCEVLKSGQANEEKQLAVLEQGSMFGEMSFFRAAPHSASVKALTDLVLIRLSREKYDQLAKNVPSAAVKIAANTAVVLAERLRKMDDWTCGLLDSPNANAHQREEWRDFRAKLYSEWEF